MKSVFLTLLNLSISACYIVAAVLLLRLVFRKAPKWTRGLLWAIVALRLICPFSIESVLSLIPAKNSVVESVIDVVPSTGTFAPSVDVTVPDIHFGLPIINETVIPAIPTVTETAEAGFDRMTVIAWAWAVGVAVMLIYMAYSYIKMKLLVREAVKDGDAWICDSVDTPFILGILRPRIYLPSTIDSGDREYVVSHEKAHLRRLDFIWKPLGFVLLAAYWFNPAVWLAYVLLCRDIELACDEKVIKELGTDCKTGYSTALINCSVSRRRISACPLAFGETAVKERVKGVLSYKKPTFWIILVSVIACVAAAVCLLTRAPAEKDVGENISAAESIDESSEELSEESGEDLTAADGVSVYVWQMGPNSYSFGLLPTREYSFGELLDKLSGTAGKTAPEIREELDKLGIDEAKITIVPYQHPLSSYIGAYWMAGKEEYRAEYINKIKAMLGLKHSSFYVSGKTYVDGFIPLNAELVWKMAEKNNYLKQSPKEIHNIIVEINSLEELKEYIYCSEHYNSHDHSSTTAQWLDDTYNKLKAFYTDEFFLGHTLLALNNTQATIGPALYVDSVTIENGKLSMNIGIDRPEVGAYAINTWGLFKEISNNILATCNEYEVTYTYYQYDSKAITGQTVLDVTQFDDRYAEPIHTDMAWPFESYKLPTVCLAHDRTMLDAIIPSFGSDGQKYNDAFFEENMLAVVKIPEKDVDYKINGYTGGIRYHGNDIYIFITGNGVTTEEKQSFTNAVLVEIPKSKGENARYAVWIDKYYIGKDE